MSLDKGIEHGIVEAEDWESAFWKAWDSLKECIASITAIPAEGDE